MTAVILIEWSLASVVMASLYVRALPARVDEIREVNSPRRLRHDSGHQRLERGSFSERANQSNHGSGN